MAESVAQVLAVMGRGVLEPTEAFITADDLGVTRGDGCFDATAVIVDGKHTEVQHLERHLARFARSRAAMELPPPDLPAWRALIDAAAGAWHAPGVAALKLVCTRGPEHRADGATEFCTITPVPPTQNQPISIVTLQRGYPSTAFGGAPWLLGGVKTISYAINVAVKREAARRGADDVLFVSADGFCLEGPTSALIASVDGELLTTPVGATGILASVSVDVIREALAATERPLLDRLVTTEQLATCDGAWLASSVRGVAPIARLDDRALPIDRATSELLAKCAGWEL